MSEKVVAIYLKDMRTQLRGLKTLADRALSQVKDEELPVEIDEESNSITILMKHVSGNITTLWTSPPGTRRGMARKTQRPRVHTHRRGH